MMRTIALLLVGATLVLGGGVKAATMDPGMIAYLALDDSSTNLAAFVAGDYGGFSYQLDSGGTPTNTGITQSANNSAGISAPSNTAGAPSQSSGTNTGSVSPGSGTTILPPSGGGGGSSPLPVPLPGSALMLGAALVVFGMAGFSTKRRSARTEA